MKSQRTSKRNIRRLSPDIRRRARDGRRRRPHGFETLENRDLFAVTPISSLLLAPPPEAEPTSIMADSSGLASLSGVTFEDLDGDAHRDADDLGANGWRIHLLNDDNGDFHFTDTQDVGGSSGVFSFDGLEPGNYTLHQIPQPFWESTFAGSIANGSVGSFGVYHLTLSAGESRDDLDFGNAVEGSINGFKFRDQNANGIFDQGQDVPQAGVDFRVAGVTGRGDVVDVTVTTGADGRFSVGELLPSVAGESQGTGFTVTEIVPNGDAPTTPTQRHIDLFSRQQKVALEGQAERLETIDVGMDGRLRGDGDDSLSVGPFDANIPVAAYEVTLVSADFGAEHGNQNQHEEQYYVELEDAEDRLVFRSALIGDLADENNQRSQVVNPFVVIEREAIRLKAFHVSVIRPELRGRVNSIDPIRATFRPLDPRIEMPADLQFGNTEPGEVRGEKFEDLDGDAVRDEDEPGLNRWEIELVDANSGAVVSSTITQTIDDVAGRFAFTGVPPGDYIVREVPPLASWTQTFPAALTEHGGQHVHQISLGIGQHVDGIDFGNAARGSLQGFKFDDIDGDSIYNPDVDQPMANVTFRLTGVDGLGNSVNRLMVTGPDGLFHFDELNPSVRGGGPATGYRVEEVVPPNTEPTTPPSFTTDLHSREVFVAEAGQAMLRPDALRVEELVPTDEGRLNAPRAVALGPDDTLYVADDGSDQVLRFDARTGEFIDIFIDSAVNDPLGVSDPGMGLEVRDEFLYVVNDGTHEVLRYDIATGDRDATFAALVPDAGAKKLRDLAFGPDGSLYVSHTLPGGVVRFNADGSFHSQFASGLVGARGVAVDADGNVYVVIRTSDVVKRFAPDGTFLDDFIDGAGGGPEDLAADWDLNGDDIPDFLISDSSTGTVGLYDGATGTRLGRLVDLPLQTPRGLFVRGIEILVAGAASGNVAYVSVDPRMETELGSSLRFGNQQTGGEIQGTKIIDANANGQRDLVELGMAGVVIYADLNGNHVLDEEEVQFSTTTREDDPQTLDDETGEFALTLPLGSFTIREVVPAGFHQSFPEGAHEVQLVEPGQIISGRDFGNAFGPLGNAFPGDIIGCKFHDLDGDGRLEPREPGLPGITIDLFREVDGEFELFRSAVTGEDGMYAFRDLAPGRYRVRENLLDGVIQTTPLLPDVRLFSDQTIVFGTCNAVPNSAPSSPPSVPDLAAQSAPSADAIADAVLPADPSPLEGNATPPGRTLGLVTQHASSRISVLADSGPSGVVATGIASTDADSTNEGFADVVSNRRASRLDVDGDGRVSARDSGLIIASIRDTGLRSVNPQVFASESLDVNLDRYITSIDVLLIVNALSLSAEGESAANGDATAEPAGEQPGLAPVGQSPVRLPLSTAAPDADAPTPARPLAELLGARMETSRNEPASNLAAAMGRRVRVPTRIDDLFDKDDWLLEFDEGLLDDILLPLVEQSQR